MDRWIIDRWMGDAWMSGGYMDNGWMGDGWMNGWVDISSKIASHPGLWVSHLAVLACLLWL